jgi:hypothetical protein
MTCEEHGLAIVESRLVGAEWFEDLYECEYLLRTRPSPSHTDQLYGTRSSEDKYVVIYLTSLANAWQHEKS